MHDLALHLGMTAGQLSRSLTVREFGDWQRYAGTRMLPLRRIELYLAQIAYWIAGTGGAKDASLQDFMFDSIGDDAGDVDGDDLDQAIDFFGFAPVKKG